MKHLASLAFICAFYVLANPPIAIGQGSVADDRAALVALYDATAGDNWLYSTNWKSDDDLAGWYGVSTDATGRVTSINLENIQLNGQLPAELENLAKLRAINLSYNQLTGELPVELGNLLNLVHLSLSNNQLTGELPTELGNLANLKTLWFPDNQLTGEIPEALENLINLKGISLANNRLRGTIPFELCQIVSSDFVAADFSGNPSLDTTCSQIPGDLLSDQDFARHEKKIFNLNSGSPEFVLLQENSYGKLWISIDYLRKFNISAKLLNYILEQVFSSTPIDSTRGSLEYSTDLLGTVRKNYQNGNNGIRTVDILLHNHSWAKGGIGGLAYPYHLEVSVFALNKHSAEFLARVIAHEYAHSINFSYSWTASFVGEGLAEWAARDMIFNHRHISSQILTALHPEYRHYFEYRGLPLLRSYPFNYSRANSFVAYMVERVGGIKPILQICHPGAVCDSDNPDFRGWYQGVDGLEYALSLSDLNLADIVSDYHTTNLVNDLSVMKDDVAYGYRSMKYAHPDFRINPEIFVSFDNNNNMSQHMIEIRPGGVDYIRYKETSDLHLSISTSNPKITSLRVFKEKRDTKELVDIDPVPGEGEYAEYLVSGDYDRVTLIAVHNNPRRDQPDLTLDISAKQNYVVSAEDEELPVVFALEQNYPNPFNPETVIEYDLPQTGHVRLAVYDMTGRMVAVLVDGARPRGRYTERFDATGLSTGMYIYRLTAGGASQTKIMTLIR